MSKKLNRILDELDLSRLSDEQLQRIADGEHPVEAILADFWVNADGQMSQKEGGSFNEVPPSIERLRVIDEALERLYEMMPKAVNILHEILNDDSVDMEVRAKAAITVLEVAYQINTEDEEE